MGTFSTNLLLSILAFGESTANGFDNWGESANFNFNRVDAKLGNKTTKSLTSGDVTLSAAEETALVLELTGTLPADRTVNISDRPGFWIVSNVATGGYGVSIEPNGGTSLVLPDGYSIIYSDGNEPVAVQTGSNVAFMAHKNGAGQSVTIVERITFGTTEFNDGGYYNTTDSRFTPPAGKYRLSASYAVQLGSGNRSMLLELRKNGNVIKRARGYADGLYLAQPQISVLVEANGTDYFEIWYGTTDAFTIIGNAADTWFCGEAL